MSEITLHVGGLKWSGWLNAGITRSIDAVFAEFTLTLTQGWPGQPGEGVPPVRRGQDCKLVLDGKTVITGYINEHDLETDSDGFELKVSGRDRTGLLFKSSILKVPLEWLNQSALQIISDICAPFDIKVTAQAPVGDPFEKFTAKPGETARRAIERLCRHRALLYFADRNGNLVLTTSDQATTAHVGLVHGPDGNVIGSRNKASLSGRNSEYIVRGQDKGKEWETAAHTQVYGSARDNGVSHYCPRVIIADEPGDNTALQKMVTTMAAVNAGRSLDLSYTVAGWRQGPGLPLWDINQLVQIKDVLDISDTTRLIKRCAFSVSEDSGPETVLTVIDPQAYSLIAEPEKQDDVRWP